jgi:uncharacterized protein with HEPN domain
MPLDRQTEARLWDILSAAEEINGFVAGLSREQYLTNRMARRAVEKDLEIIGEAVNALPMDFRDSHPDASWRDAIGLRNILVHRYGRVDHEILWTIIHTSLPELMESIRTLLPPSPPDPEP